MEQEPKSARTGEFNSLATPEESIGSLKEPNSLALNAIETVENTKETIILDEKTIDTDSIIDSKLDRDKIIDDFPNKIDDKLSSLRNKISESKMPDNSRHHKPKKKRRKHNSVSGSSLQALLQKNTSEEHFSVSNSSSSSDSSENLELEERDTIKKTRKRKSSNRKSLKKNREKYRLYINDQAEEDESDADSVGSLEASNRTKKDFYSSDDDDEEDEDEDVYNELKDFIADEVEEEGIDDHLVYNGSHLKLNKDDLVEGSSPISNNNVEDQESSDDDDDDEILRGGIEEDDLALIEENTGLRIRKESQKHRLKKVSESHDLSDQTLIGKNIGDLEDLLFNTGADNDESQVPYQNDPISATSFDSEYEDEDNWMVDDMDEKGLRGDEFNIIQSVFGDYDTVMDILMNKVHKPKENMSANDNTFDRSQSKVVEDSKTNFEHDNIYNEQLSSSAVDLKEEGEIEQIQDQIKKTTLHTLRSIAEPDELQGQFLTDFDTEVRQVDIPERLYLLYNQRWKLLKNQKILKEELQDEALWITQKFLQTYPELFKEDLVRRAHSLEYKSSFPYTSNGVFQLLSSAIFCVLDWLLNERLDIPYIYSHKMHLIQPPLNDFLIGKIVFLDSVYYKLKISMESFYLKLKSYRESETIIKYSSIPESQDSLDDNIISSYLSVSGLNDVISTCMNFESTRDVDQIRLYIMYHIDTPRFKQILLETNNESAEQHIQDNAIISIRKQRRNFTIELFEYIESQKLYNIWNSHIVSPYIFSLYLKSFSYPQFHCSVPTSSTCGLPSTFSLLPPGGPILENSKSALHKWFEKYIKSDSHYFMTTEKIIESLIIYESKRLATFPTIRSKIYKYFLSNACVTTVTTVKGERTLTPNNTSWLAKRLFRKPINTLFPGTYQSVNEEFNDSTSNFNALFDGCLSSEIFELEKHGLINIVIHPLCIDDEAPWRGSDGENKIKERFLHEIGLLNSGIESTSSSSGFKGSLPTPIFNRFEQEMRMFKNSDNIDNRIVRKILEELKYGYVSISGSIWSKLIQIPILHRLIEKELFPIFRQDILSYMKSRSEEYIAELCSLNLQKRLRILPPKKPNTRDLSIEDHQKRRMENKNDHNIDLASDDDDFISSRYRGRGISKRNENYYQFKEEYNTNWGLNIISCVVDRAENGFKVCVVALDVFGELRDYLILDHLLNAGLHNSLKFGNQNERDTNSLDSQRFEEDLENLMKFTKIYYPHYVCIGISNRKSLDLGNLWNNVVFKKVKRKDLDYTSSIFFVSMDVSRALVRRLNSNSTNSDSKTKNFKTRGLSSDYPVSVHLAISVGRLVQNPLAEQLQLWEDTNNEIERELSVNHLSSDKNNVHNSDLVGTKTHFNSITCLRLHRFQNCVDSKLLQFHLLMVIRSVVSNLGVQLNRMKGHTHLQSPLKFLSGLGPRKAKILSFYIDSLSEPIYSRSQLKISENSSLNSNSKNDYDDEYNENGEKQSGCLTKNVFLNSEIFLRVDEESIYEKEFNKNLNIFDISRLSYIDDKELVLTILGNIKDQISEENNNSVSKQKTKEKDETLYWNWISKRTSMLETLDLEAYAKLMYENQDRPRLLPYLNKMLRELKKPYDCSYFAKEFRGIEKSRQFKEAMEINKEDLFIGCEITCRINNVLVNNRGLSSSSRSPISLWFDQYNMKVVIEDFDIFWEEFLDENPKFQSIPIDAIFKVNTPLQVIVSNIEFSQQCVFVLMSQGKICSTLNYLLDNIWRQQQYRIELLEKHRHEVLSNTGASNKDLAINKEYKNDFNLLQDDLSCLTWTDIRHFSYILFKKNLNVIVNSSGIDLSSNKAGKGGYMNKEGHMKIFETKSGRTFGGSIHRTIHHPNYRNWTHEEILNYMKNETIPLGEVVIKSSNKHIDKLSMYIKVCENPFMFKIINIDEFDQRLPGELGRRLRIDDTEYSDIDQILIQYVHPLKVHLSNIYSHSKYRVNMEYQSLVTELLVESTRSGNSIVWGIVVDKQIPCRFHLISVPPNTRVGSSGARIHFEDGIYVNYKGFQLWRRSENTLRKLLNWWKTDGFFKRTQHLEDYKRYKEFMVKQKQGKGTTDAEFSSKKVGNIYYGNSSNYQSSRHFQDNHHQMYRSEGTFAYHHSNNSNYHGGSGSFRKSFHGYPQR